MTLRNAARCRLYGTVGEEDWQTQVRAWAVREDWLEYHTWRSDRSPRGFPDLVLARRGRLIFAELKTEKGRLSADQEAWLTRLQDCPGCETYVWRPHDEDRVRAVLAR